MNQLAIVLVSCATLCACSSKAPQKNEFPVCPEFQSAMCPYGMMEILDTNRGCLQHICTETQGVIEQDPVEGKDPVPDAVLRPGGCDVEGREWILEITLRSPRMKSLSKLEAELKRALPTATLVCIRSGETALRLSTGDLRGFLGKEHVNLYCTRGAGNSLGATGYFALIKPEEYVPDAYRSFVKRFFINTDPKYDLYDETDPVPCHVEDK